MALALSLSLSLALALRPVQRSSGNADSAGGLTLPLPLPLPRSRRRRRAAMSSASDLDVSGSASAAATKATSTSVRTSDLTPADAPPASTHAAGAGAGTGAGAGAGAGAGVGAHAHSGGLGPTSPTHSPIVGPGKMAIVRKLRLGAGAVVDGVKAAGARWTPPASPRGGSTPPSENVFGSSSPPTESIVLTQPSSVAESSQASSMRSKSPITTPSGAAPPTSPPLSPSSLMEGIRRKSAAPKHLATTAVDRLVRAMRSREPAAAPMDISGPTGVVHVNHVVFDEKHLTFQGLPSEWADNAHPGGIYTQFGCSISSVPRLAVDGYHERIPAVLVQLRDELNRHAGLTVEGVFRVAPAQDEQKAYKSQVDSGTFRGCKTAEDSACMAALIKEWFRVMPVRLLNALPLSSIKRGEADVLAELPEPNLSVFVWLADLLAETVEHEHENRMSIKAVAVVVAPNLYAPAPNATAKEIVEETSGVVSIVEKFVAERVAVRAERRARGAARVGGF